MSNSTKQNDLPPELRNALEAVARTLERSYITVCHVMQTLCCDSIHDTNSDDHEDCSEALSKWLSDGRWSPDESNHWYFSFKRLEIQEGVPWGGWHSSCTPSFAFKTCSDYLVEHIAIDVRRIFADLMEVAVKYEAVLKQSGIAWTETQVLRLIQSHRHRVVEWVHKACDRFVTDPWQARLFLTMQPVRSTPYDEERAMEQMDPASSLKLAEARADKHVRKLEEYIREDAENAYLRAAKQSPAAPIIDQKLIAKRSMAAQKADPDAKKSFAWKLEHHATVSTVEFMQEYGLKDSGVKHWKRMGILRSGGRGLLTSDSVRRYIEERMPVEKPKKSG